MRWNHISVPPLLACLPRNPFRAMLSMFCFPVPWNRYTMWWKGAERRCWRSSKRFFKLVRRRKKGKEGKEGKVGKVGKVGRYDDAAEFEVKVQRAGRGVNGICEWDRTHIYTLKAGTNENNTGKRTAARNKATCGVVRVFPPAAVGCRCTWHGAASLKVASDATHS